MMRKRIIAVLLVLSLAALFAAPAFAAQPSVTLSSGACRIGETVTVLLEMSDVAGFTAGDLHIQYNPHLVRLTKVEACDDINTKGVYHAETELTKTENELDLTGQPVHNFNISIFHEEKFPQSLNHCELFRLTFTAIAGGECPLVLGSSSFYIGDSEVYPLLTSGVIRIEGEEGLTWDYAKNVIDDVIYTDKAYPYAPLSTTQLRTYASTTPGQNAGNAASAAKQNGARVAIIAAVGVAVVGAVVAVVIVSGKNKYVKDDEKKGK